MYNNLKKPSKEELRQLLQVGTNEFAAKQLGCHGRTIQRWRDEYGLNQEIVSIGDYQPTSEQMDLLNGWMLGDGSIRYLVENRKTLFCFVQKTERKEYVQFVYDSLLPYSSNVKDGEPRNGPKIINGQIIQGEGPLCYSTRMQTIVSNLFVDLRKKWYLNPYEKRSQKIIPEIKLNWKTFSYWFADDGNNSPARKSVSFATQSFSKNDVEKLIFFIKRDLNLNAWSLNSKTGPIIMTGAKDYHQIVEKLNDNLGHLKCLSSKLNSQYIHDYLKYKSGFDTETVNQIWNLYLGGMSNDNITKQFNISPATLFRIIKKKSLETKTDITHQGENSSSSKLNNEKVKQIIEKWNQGNLTQNEIAKEFSVTQTNVSMIILRKTWKHLNLEIKSR